MPHRTQLPARRAYPARPARPAVLARPTRLARLVIVVGLLIAPLASAQRGAKADEPRPLPSGSPLTPGEACYDVKHYDLRLSVDPGGERIDGSLRMTAEIVTDTERVVLDLDGHLEVSDVLVDGEPAEWAHQAGRIMIALPEPKRVDDVLVVTIAYGGVPRVAPTPPWDGGFTWSRTPDGYPWIATTCQGEGADLWWPCKDSPSDKPDGMDLVIDVPKGLFVASNGRLVSQRTEGGRTTFHWRSTQPISNYAVALNIAPYVALEETFESVDGTSFPFVFYALPEHVEKARAILPQFMDHIHFFEDVLGPYPFRADKYGVVETPHLGMEHQTIIAYGNAFVPGRWPDYDWLHHHEASHEWWGNLVTCRDWKDMWIHEGLGTYMQALYLERRFGEEAYEAEMAANRHFVNGKAVAPRETMDSKQIYFQPNGGYDNDIYSKGSWVAHTLRWLLGDETFFAVLRRWAYPDPALERVTDGSQTRLTDTDELLAIAEDVSGVELGWFFEVYLRQPVVPVLHETWDGDDLHLAWEVPDELPFPLPVPVLVDGEVLRVEMADGQAVLPGVGGRAVEIDPHARLLARRRP